MVDFIFAIGEVFLVVSYMFSNILLLRLITIVGMLAYVIGAFVAGYNSPGMKAMIIFSVISVLINIYKIFIILTERKSIFLPEEIKSIYSKMFSSMTASDFLKLYKLSQPLKYKKDEVLIHQNQRVEYLIAINKGNAHIIKNGQHITTLDPGHFIGEMSFISGEPAKATVAAETDLECLAWQLETLHSLGKKNSELLTKLKEAISLNLIKKI